jgi:hypothetical protein
MEQWRTKGMAASPTASRQGGTTYYAKKGTYQKNRQTFLNFNGYRVLVLGYSRQRSQTIRISRS